MRGPVEVLRDRRSHAVGSRRRRRSRDSGDGRVAANGRRVLEELAAGVSPGDAIERVLASDEGREIRQLGAVTADGRASAFTGSECVAFAGQIVGDGFAVQGNMLAGPRVIESMAAAFVAGSGALVDRLLAALDAAEAEGGDSRGQQAAAIVVERSGHAARGPERVDRICDLRVDDHVEPLVELRRLVTLWHEWQRT